LILTSKNHVYDEFPQKLHQRDVLLLEIERRLSVEATVGGQNNGLDLCDATHGVIILQKTSFVQAAFYELTTSALIARKTTLNSFNYHCTF